MIALSHFLTAHGPMLAVGATLLLAAGSVASLLIRAPINRQRTGELTIVAVLLWIALACVPLPRWSAPQILPIASPTSTAQLSIPPSLSSPRRPLALADESPAEAAARIQQTTEILNELATLNADQTLSGYVKDQPEPSPIPPRGSLEQASMGLPVIGDNFGPAVLAMLYLSIALLCVLWIAFGWLMLQRLTRRSAQPPAWLHRLYASLSPAPLPRLLVSARCRGAFSFGIWQPTIVLPADCCDENRTGQLRQILLHELAHLQQGDQRGRLLFNIALPLLYAHPLYWWIRNRTYLAAELVADDWAAGHSSTAAYAEELIALVKEQGRRGLVHVGTVGIFSSPTQFYRRMEMLVRRQTPLMTTCTRRWRLLTTLTAAVAVLLLSSALGVHLVQAEPDDNLNEANIGEVEQESDDFVENAQEPPETESNVEVEAPPPGIATRLESVFGATPDHNKRAKDDDEELKPPQPRSAGLAKRRLRGRGLVADHDEFFRNPFGDSSAEEMLPAIKSLRRTVLIKRLQLINRRVTDQEKQIRALLTDKDATDEELTQRIYNDLLQRPATNAEKTLVEQILKLSDDRSESIQRVLQSMDELDDAVSAALAVMELEKQLDKLEEQLQATLDVVNTLPDDLDSGAELPADAGKTLSFFEVWTREKPVSSWRELASLASSNLSFLNEESRNLQKKWAELAEFEKLNKAVQREQAKPALTAVPYNKTQLPQPTSVPAARNTGTVTKMVPRIVWETTPDGQRTAKTVYENFVVPVPATQEPVMTYSPEYQPASPAESPKPIPIEPQIEPVPDQSLSGSHPDVIKLATDYSQTHSELESAKSAYERVQSLHSKNVVSAAEMEQAAVKLGALRERLKTMQTIAEILTESLSAEINALQVESRQAQGSNDELYKAKLRTKITRVSGDLKILRTMK